MDTVEQMVNSRAKGARYEREIRDLFKAYGFEAHRTQQYSGANGDGDVTVNAPFHVECKRVEVFKLDKAVSQAIRDCPDGKIPLVFHRKFRKESLVILRAEDFMRIVKSLDASASMHGETLERILDPESDALKE